MSEQTDTEKLLADIVAGGALIIEERYPTVAPLPIPTATGSRDGRCPGCEATMFSYELGDIYGRCAGFGRQVEVPEDLV